MALDDFGRVYTEIRYGDYRRQLEALRDRLAREIDSEGTGPRELPALVKQLTEVVRALDALPTAGGMTKLDELKARRESRQAANGDDAAGAAGRLSATDA